MVGSIVVASPITQSEKAAAAAALISKQKTRAIEEINRRVVSLNKAIDKVNVVKKITNDQKNALVAQVQAEKLVLQQLKEKINTDVDKDVLLIDRKTIVQKYRTFALFEPRIAIITYADKILNLVNLMDAETTDDNVKIKIIEAKNKAQKAIDDVSILTPEGYPGNRSVLLASRDLLTAARQQLNEARVMMKQTINSSVSE